MTINKLYLVNRTDASKDQCWGDNLDMVVCVASDTDLEELIQLNLLQDHCDQPADNGHGAPLTRAEIKTTYLGLADPSVNLGVLLISNAGA